jgi:acetolactate synthase-1/2/3 large subunit
MGEKEIWRGGDLVVRALKEEGVKYIFGLSGAHINTIFDACIDFGIRVIDTRHEQAAVNMAEGWARFTGKPGVAVVTAGPGAVNAFPGVSVAMQSGSPVVIIAGRSSLERRDIGAMQDMDQIEVMHPVTKWSRSVYQTKRICEYMTSAFRQAQSGRPGPVFLEIPIDVVEGESHIEQVVWCKDYRTEHRPYGDPLAIEKAAGLLSKAQRPVIVAGGGVWWSGAGEELRALVEATNIPFYSRSMARGIIPDDHPLSGGMFPAGLTQADVVLILGAKLDWTIAYGRPPIFHPGIKVIQVDVEPEEIGKNRPVDIGIPGDARAVLSQLAQALKGKYKAPETWAATVKAMMGGVRTQFAGDIRKTGSPVHPARLAQEVREFLPRDAALVVDGGDIAIFANVLLDAYSPGSLVWVGGFGHLGVGVPYANAAKLARPERPVALLTGDGSFGLSLMELDTAVRHRIPIVCVVANNGGWGQILREQNAKYGRDRVIGSQLGLRPYHKMVEAMGGYGERVERTEDVKGALERAFQSGLPACINVITDPEPKFPGMDFPWQIT